MTALLIIAAAIAAVWFVAYHRLPAVVWTIAVAIAGVALTAWSGWPRGLLGAMWVFVVLAVLLGNPTPLRSALVRQVIKFLARATARAPDLTARFSNGKPWA